ncbi:MAG: helix-turn-helix domain-containing protein [Candidatus Diapherotrites archaeon]
MDKYELAGKIVLAPSPGKMMKQIREERGIGQGELAKKLGVKQSTLSDYEAGRRGSPGTAVVKRFVQKITEG